MLHQHGVDWWRGTTVLFAATGQTLFVLFYLTLPWWRSFMGRALFLKGFAFMVLLDTAVAARMLNWPNKDETIVSLYGLVAIGIWGELIAFISVARIDRNRHGDDSSRTGNRPRHQSRSAWETRPPSSRRPSE